MEEAGRLKRPPWLGIYVGLLVFSLAGSLLSRLTGLNPGPIAPVAGALTLLSGLAAVFAPRIEVWGWKRAAVSFGLIGLIGAGSEILGLYTGFPFGAYLYTDKWAPTIPMPGDHRFPLLLPMAWMMMAGASCLAVQRWLPEHRWAGPILGGLLAALVDVPMEAVMVGVLDYWRWLEPGPLPGGAPWSNFAGWFGTTALAGLILMPRKGETPPGDESFRVLALHLAFVLGLGLIGPVSA